MYALLFVLSVETAFVFKYEDYIGKLEVGNILRLVVRRETARVLGQKEGRS